MASKTIQSVVPTQDTSDGPRLNALSQVPKGVIRGAYDGAHSVTTVEDPLKELRNFGDAVSYSTHHGVESAKDSVQPNAPPTYTPLADETRSALSTKEAAFHLNRAQQTLRLWAMSESGPIRPLRINGRLAWKLSDLRRVLGEA